MRRPDTQSMQPAPAVAPVEPTPLTVIEDSGRRILWIVGLYRAVCAAMLRGGALLLDPRTLNVAAPNAFVTGTGLYFVFGLSTFWWVQQDRLPLPPPTMLFSLLPGDRVFPLQRDV